MSHPPDDNFTIQKVSKKWLQSRLKAAGWWAISPGNPGINPPPVDKGGLMNAIPGTDPPEARYNGDLPADIMGDTLAAINQAYLDEWGRPACPEEMKAVFDFVYGGYESGPESYLPKGKTVSLRVAARRFVADGYFSVGEEVLFGKYKNKRGKIVAFGKDDRGIPTVEIEPIPKGRKQNRTMGLYKIWKRPAERTKEACILFSKKCDGDLILGKARDRMYDPELCVYHLELDGTEMCVMFDRTTGFCEGINEHGIGIVNTSLMVLRDEAEGLAQDGGDPQRSPDGIKILKALTYDKVGDVLQSLILHKPKRFKRGLKGHTFVSDGNNIFALENTRIHAPKSMRLDSDKVHTRTNHGIHYPGAGYTKGIDYLSSIVRRWEAQKQLEKAQHAEDLMPALTQSIEKVPSTFSPTRFTDKMRTTSQLTLDPKNRRLLLYLVPEHAKFKGVRNLLPDQRKPKLKVQLFKYPGKNKLQDTSITVPEEMSVDSVKRERAEPALSPERVAARYKSKKKVKTKDGDEMTVYEYSDAQVAERDRKKAERIEKLRKSMEKLRTTVRKDVKSKDEKLRDSAIAVGLMDETFERPGNDDSASDGHFGVTTWKVKFLKFKPGSVTISYVGKSDVDQKKKITNSRLVSALRKVCKDKKPEDMVLSVSADEVNEYLKPFDITAKDIRGFHANREMKEQLKKVRKGALPKDPKEREKKLKGEFDEALEATAKRVGHEPSTLKSQYLVPGLEDDYKDDGTINESHTKKGAEAVTDTASFYVIAPEALKGMLDDTDWLELAHDLWPGGGRFPQGGVGDLVGTMERHVQESGGAVLNTGWDGGFDIGVKGKIPAQGAAPVPFDLPVREKGALPPYGLRHAAEHGTETERRILANACHGPVLVARTRDWWVREAPNIYRFARDHERPRPEVEGLRFAPEMFSVLWYEDADGNNLGDGDLEGEPGAPEGAQTQHSQFPHVLRHNVLRLNDDGTSSTIATGESSFPEDLVSAMVRSDDWDVGDAIMVAGQSCERCMNVLANHYGLDWGYAFGSDDYEKCGTSCGMCEHHEKAATKSDAQVEEEQIQKMLRKEPKKKPPRYDLRDNRTLDEEDEEEDLGGGDGGDRDLSLKWNKVATGRRVAFRWLALPRGVSESRVALRFEAREPPAAEEAKTQPPKQDRPTFEEWVKEKRWPSKAKEAPPGAEVGFEGLKKQDPTKAEQVRAEYKRQYGVTEEEEGEGKKPKEAPEKERTREDVDAELQEVRGNADELRDSIEEAEEQIAASKKKIEQLKAKLRGPQADPEAARKELEEQLEGEMEKVRAIVPDLKARGKEIDKLKDESEDLAKEIEADKKDLARLRSTLERPAVEPGAKKEKIESQLGDAKKTLEETKTETESLDTELDDLEEKQGKLEGAKKDIKKLIKDLERNLGHLPAEHPATDDVRDKIREVRRELREKTFEGKRVKKEVDAKTKRLEDLRQRTEDSEKLVGQLEEALEKVGEEPEEGPVDKGAIQSEIDSRREALREKEGHFKDLGEEIKEKEQEYDTRRKAGKAQAKRVKALEAKLEEPVPEAADQEGLRGQIKEERKKQRQLEDEVEDKQEELKDAEEREKELKEERRDPTGAKKKKEEAAKKKRTEKVKAAIEKTTKTMGSLLGKESTLPKGVKDQIADQLGDLDETQLEQFSLDFESDLKDLIEQGPMAADSVRMANAVAKMGFSTEGITDPEELAKRVAQISFARNVVANPMVTAGKPVGQAEMPTAAEYGARAKEGFQQFQRLNPKLRAEAGATIQKALKGLDPESNRAKELNALLTGIATAQVADTGDSLPGRPQPSKGAAALIRAMVKQGEVDQVFAPAEDMFSEDSQKAYESALGAMSDVDLGEFIIGDDENHPFYWMKEVLSEWEGGDEYKEFLKDFLREDFMQDMWADRAFRDVMQADGLEEADDPEVRANLTQEAKRENGARLEEAHKAMDRISEAMERGEDPDPKDVEMAQYLDPEVGVGLRENAGSVLDKIKETFKSKVVSPALAVLNHFRNTGEADVKKTETLPHPDESAKEPRTKEEREKAKAEAEAEKPEVSEEDARKERVKLKALRQKLKAQRGKVSPEEQAKIDEKLKSIDERLKGVQPETREEARARSYAESEWDEYAENELTKQMFPDAFDSQEEFTRAVVGAPVEEKKDWSKLHSWGGSVGNVRRGDLDSVRDEVWGYNQDRWLPKAKGDEKEARRLFEEYFAKLVDGVRKGQVPPTLVGVHKDEETGKETEYILGGNTRAMIHEALGIPTPVKAIPLKGKMNEPGEEGFDEDVAEKERKRQEGESVAEKPEKAEKPKPLEGYRAAEDAPEFDGGSKEWVAEHETTTPGGSYVLGTPHVGEGDESDKWISDTLIPSAVSAAEKALKDGKKVVFLAEGGNADKGSWHQEQNTEQGQVAAALDKLGDIEHGTWDDETVGIDKEEGDKLRVDRDSAAVKSLIDRHKDPALVEAALAAAMWDQMPEDENPYTLSDEAREALQSRGINPDDKKSLSKMWEDDELSDVAESYARMRDENIARKIKEVEDAGGVAIVTPGAQHAYQLRDSLKGPAKEPEKPKVNKKRLERLKAIRDKAKEKYKELSGPERDRLKSRLEQVDRVIRQAEEGIEPEAAKPEEAERKSPLDKLKALREKAKARLEKLAPSARKRLGDKLQQLNKLISRQEEETADDEEHGPGDVWQTEAGNWRAKNQKGVPHSFKDKEKAEAYAESKEEQKEEWSAAFDVPVPERGPTKFASEKVAEEVAEVWMAYIRSFHPDDPNRPIIYLDAA